MLNPESAIPWRVVSLLHAFNAANASRQIGAEEYAIGGLVCEPTYGTET
jgi:hypothetical protein